MDVSFSQFGEDLLILRALESINKLHDCFYVDVGAFDPVIYSNTLRLNWLGWSGINIDAQENHVEQFRKHRPNDINLHYAIAKDEGFADFLLYASATTGRLADPHNRTNHSILGENVLNRITVPTQTLRGILSQYRPSGKDFGLLNIDCEGTDAIVLQSNDWDKFRPWVVAIEDHSKEKVSHIDCFLGSKGYENWAKANVTKLFVKKE